MEKRWYHILAHGIGPNTKNGQEYESEIFNINGDIVAFDSLSKMNDFMDETNKILSAGGRILGKKLPFVLLQIQSTPNKINSEVVTEEWYVYSLGDSVQKLTNTNK